MSAPNGFERLMRMHDGVLAAAIRRVCGRRHGSLVPDVRQEAYLALWKRLQSGSPIEQPVSYFYKVGLTTALAMVRKLDPVLPAPETTAGGGAAGGRGALHPLERARLVDQILARLDPEEARALDAYLAGFNHVELARLSGCTESVARHRIYRSLERLRKNIRRPAEGRSAGTDRAHEAPAPFDGLRG